MSERYWVSGVQLGLLRACVEKDIGNFISVLHEIEDNQFVGRIEEEDKKKLKVGIIKDE